MVGASLGHGWGTGNGWGKHAWGKVGARQGWGTVELITFKFNRLGQAWGYGWGMELGHKNEILGEWLGHGWGKLLNDVTS